MSDKPRTPDPEWERSRKEWARHRRRAARNLKALWKTIEYLKECLQGPLPGPGRKD